MKNAFLAGKNTDQKLEAGFWRVEKYPPKMKNLKSAGIKVNLNTRQIRISPFRRVLFSNAASGYRFSGIAFITALRISEELVVAYDRGCYSGKVR